MVYRDKQKKKETLKAYRNSHRDEYNAGQRRFQKAWRSKNKDKVRKYNEARVNRGIVRKCHRRAINQISDSYVKSILKKNPGKTIVLKRADILRFRIKKLIKNIADAK